MMTNKKPTAEQKARIDRIMNPRNTMIGARSTAEQVARWHRAAEAAGVLYVEFIEDALDKAADRVLK